MSILSYIIEGSIKSRHTREPLNNCLAKFVCKAFSDYLFIQFHSFNLFILQIRKIPCRIGI
jgi:hypothetical protein